MKKTPFFVKRGEILVPTNPTRFNRDKYSEKMTDSSLSLTYKQEHFDEEMNEVCEDDF